MFTTKLKSTRVALWEGEGGGLDQGSDVGAGGLQKQARPLPLFLFLVLCLQLIIVGRRVRVQKILGTTEHQIWYYGSKKIEADLETKLRRMLKPRRSSANYGLLAS